MIFNPLCHYIYCIDDIDYISFLLFHICDSDVHTVSATLYMYLLE